MAALFWRIHLESSATRVCLLWCKRKILYHPVCERKDNSGLDSQGTVEAIVAIRSCCIIHGLKLGSLPVSG